MKSLKLALTGLVTLLAAMLAAPCAQAFKPTLESGHVGIVKNALTRISVPSPDGISSYKFSDRAILQIRDSVAGVDELISSRGELNEPTAHCDDELLPECTQRIIDIKKTIIALLSSSSPDGSEARRQAGRALHTLQDFFSHSNWINISTGDPGLGAIVVARLGPDKDTCQRGFSSLGAGTLDRFGLTNATTGYFSLVLAPPDGKCNHGLLLDPGIHKDLPGREGHDLARATAVDSTENFIRQILTAPGVDGNDRAIRAFLDVRGAIGFVVDDTGSMGGVIAGVKASIANIVTSVRNSKTPPDRYVLVNFGDPFVGEAYVTDSADALLSRANTLVASGGGDCPELSMAGTLRAINAAPLGSQLYVFTDASSKDASLFGNVITQANSKNINVSFLTFGSCSPIDPAYFAIAAETGGQLFALSRSTSETQKIFGLITPYVSGSPKPLLVAKGAIGGTRMFDFPVDPTMRSLLVSVAVDAGGQSTLFDPQGREIVAGMAGVTITPLSGGKLIAVTTPSAGVWNLTISGTGNYDISLTGDSILELNRFEFVETRGRDGHTGLFPIKSQPLAAVIQQARATLFGAISTAQFELVNKAGNSITSLPMTSAGNDSTADEFLASFMLPTEKFRVLVKGQLQSGESYQRVYSPLFFGRSVKVDALGGGFGLFSPGQTYTVRFLVTNLGVQDLFQATAVDERRFIGNVTPASFTLGQNGSRVVEVSLYIPAATPIGTTNNISLVAKGASMANGTVFTQIVRAATIAGDIDGDGDVDRDDIAIIFAARNQTSSGNADPRDFDRDGKITVLDARKVTLLCTRPKCSRE